MPLGGARPAGCGEDRHGSAAAGEARRADRVARIASASRLRRFIRSKTPLPVSVTRDFGDVQVRLLAREPRLLGRPDAVARQSELPASRAGDYSAFRRVVQTDAKQGSSLEAPASEAAPPASDVKVADLDKRGVRGDHGGRLHPGDRRSSSASSSSSRSTRRHGSSWAARTSASSATRGGDCRLQEAGRAESVRRVRLQELGAASTCSSAATPTPKRSSASSSRSTRSTRTRTRPRAAVCRLEEVRRRRAGAREGGVADAQGTRPSTSLLGKALSERSARTTRRLRRSTGDRAQSVPLACGTTSPTSWRAASAGSRPRAALRRIGGHGDDRRLSQHLGRAGHRSAISVLVSSLAAQWDTLGWVHFMSGDAAPRRAARARLVAAGRPRRSRRSPRADLREARAQGRGGRRCTRSR